MSAPWLVACEYSATVRDALRAAGIDAYSCDLEPTEGDPRYPIQDDAVKVAYGHNWGAMIAHPVCTRMANSGSKHLYIGCRKENGRNLDRWALLEKDAAFYRALRDAPIPLKAIENSVMHRHAIALTQRGPTQFVHPHYFGSPFFKLTGLELIGFPPLVRTHHMEVPKPGTAEHRAWSKCHQMKPSADRGKERARFDPALAAAIAAQWGLLAEQRAAA